jgi:EAL domain-containing protein (putative c-di-GMP-specific phosphodiesterase class I)
MSLVRNIHNNISRSDMVKALVNYANIHKIKVLAEGIETVEELNEVKKLGIHYVQGYYFAKPQKDLNNLIIENV